MAIATVNGVRLYHEVRGEGAAILGIHGTPSSCSLWADAAQALAALGRCVVYDRRGFARSERPEPFDRSDLDDHVADAAGLLELLSAAPAVVIGRSTGGQIALALARSRPDLVRALVLLEPALLSIDPAADAWARELRMRILRAGEQDPAAASEEVVREFLGGDAWTGLPGELRDVFADAGPAVLAEARGAGLDLSAEPLVLGRQELGAIVQPTLLLSGADSPEVLRRVSERLAEALPDVRSVQVPGGHLIHPAHPAVLDFVARVLDAR